MPRANLEKELQAVLCDLTQQNLAKGDEPVVVRVKGAAGKHGPRYYLEGYEKHGFIRMNSNSYLGLAFEERLHRAAHKAAARYGLGPGAVRFISGTYRPHQDLERRLAEFHGREDCLLHSAAYTTVLGVLTTLTDPETIIISDELNHNCIITAMKLARPKDKKVYRHLDMAGLERAVQASIGRCQKAIIVTDGVFSMRGDHAPLDEIGRLARRYNDSFPQDILVVVDDSHGVGAFGKTGRGTEEYTAAGVDVLIATLGKAFGVNGGYVVSSRIIIQYLREKNPFYIYTNPITPMEAAAALEALNILDSRKGLRRLAHLRAMTARFEKGLVNLGYETIPGEHPVVPLLVRDADQTTRLVNFLRDHGVLATGLNYPIVPKGDETIRFQVCADHTKDDIAYVLKILSAFKIRESHKVQ